MALRRGQPITVKDWRGLNTWADAENLSAASWTDSMNVFVNQAGSAQVLRSPATFNDSTGHNLPVGSIFSYQKQSGPIAIFDVIGTTLNTTRTYTTTGTTNTLIRSGQANSRWKSLTINDMAYRVNGTEFVQTDGTNFYTVGITAPAAAPTIAYGSGTGEITTSINVSYAYRNSVTRDISRMSDPSNTLTASGASASLEIDVVASGQTGVDGIVIFATTDNGVVRYLLIDVDGDPEVHPNTTGTIEIDISDLYYDTQVEETFYNYSAPTDAYFIAEWKDRVYAMDFRSGDRSRIQFSAFEAVPYGTPSAAWPPSNLLNLSNKADSAKGGISTQLGFLILGIQDSYLLTGTPSDKVSSSDVTAAITEHLDPMNWRIGTRSPKTLATTPFGEIWLDQTKRLQMWTHGEGPPVEIGLTIRNLLSDLDDDELDHAEGVWFQHGENGGNYILSASTDGATHNRLFIISIYHDPETRDLHTACAVSDFLSHSIGVLELDGVQRCFIGAQGWMKEILADIEGEGYDCQDRFFEFYAANDGEFSYFQNLRFDASDVTGLRIIVTNPDGTEERRLELVQPTGAGGAWYATMDVYGRRKKVRFEWSARDDLSRNIKNIRIAAKQTGRLM